MDNLVYTRQAEDIAFRKVNISCENTPDFQDFTGEQQKICYPQSLILEILRSDGSTVLYFDEDQREATYIVEDPNTFRVAAGIPTERLWLRQKEGTGIWYKVPASLPMDSYKRAAVSVPGGVNSWELIGDVYFSKAYDLQRK